MVLPKEQVMVTRAEKSLSGDFDNYDGYWFEFEPHLTDVNYFLRSHMQEWKHLSFIVSFSYISLVFLGKRTMRKRHRYLLETPLFIWNSLMALWSFFIVVRIAPFAFRKLFHSTFYGVICDGSCAMEAPGVMILFSPLKLFLFFYKILFSTVQLVFWVGIFGLSKPIEFIDTLFVILRKQQLTFLHWYHHASVVVICWYMGGANHGPVVSMYFAVINSFIHFLMYFFFACKVR